MGTVIQEQLQGLSGQALPAVRLPDNDADAGPQMQGIKVKEIDGAYRQVVGGASERSSARRYKVSDLRNMSL
jgi:hypothetical protein